MDFGLQAPRINSYIEKVDYHCSCGPEDNRDGGGSSREGTPAPSQGKKTDGSRMDRIGLGYSCRVGCRVRFTTRIQPGTEDITEIQYYEMDHINHGLAAPVCADQTLVDACAFLTLEMSIAELDVPCLHCLTSHNVLNADIGWSLPRLHEPSYLSFPARQSSNENPQRIDQC